MTAVALVSVLAAILVVGRALVVARVLVGALIDAAVVILGFALTFTAIEAQLRSQAARGSLDACRLAVTTPPTFFDFSDGTPLKAVIGGTQGETLILNAFSGSLATRSYNAQLRFLICDDFGVDESDLYAPGLFGFWVLQHERSATKYKPFINELDLTVTVSGAF